MRYRGVEVVCGRCGSERLSDMLLPAGVFVCMACGAALPYAARNPAIMRFTYHEPGEGPIPMTYQAVPGERDWDAEMSELWKAEGYMVA